MHYLTVQDVLWIHLQIAKKQGKFSYAKLEEATNYQYAYGKSRDVLAQASRFFTGFVAKNPFDDGNNRAVAFAAGIAFLELNGLQFSPNEKDMATWMDQATNLATSKDTLKSSTSLNHDGHGAEARTVAKAVLGKYEVDIKKMLK